MQKTDGQSSAREALALTPAEQEQFKSVSGQWQEALNTMTPQEQEEVLRTAERIRPGIITDGIYQPCPDEKRPIKKNCVEPSGKLGVGEAAQQKILADAEAETGQTMKADVGKLLAWEKNYAGAYVPWGPEFQKRTVNVGSRNIDVLIPSTERDRGSLRGWKTGADKNSAGVTVGMGVDLGRKSAKEIDDLVNFGVKGTGVLNEQQAQALKDRLKPYIGKIRAEACQFLRMNPLTLSQDEVDALNYASVKDHLVRASKSYENNTRASFGALAEQEQTLLLSTHYHTGNIPKKLAIPLSRGNYVGVLQQLTKSDREYSYLKSYYDSLSDQK